MSTNTNSAKTNQPGLSLIRTKVVVGGNKSDGDVTKDACGIPLMDGYVLGD